MPLYKFDEDLYSAFLEASSIRYSCLALSDVSPKPLSHDGVSRWLGNGSFRPRDIWRTAKEFIDQEEASILIVDDTVLSKRHSKKMDLVDHQDSGNAHDVIAGIGLVNLLWYDCKQKQAIPVDYLIYDKDSDGKSKNTHFCDMLSLAKKRGLCPDAVVMDSWYSSLKNLKAIRDHCWHWVCGLRKNRKVNRDESLGNLIIPDEGLKIHLRGYGWVMVFKFVAKNGRVDYMTTNLESPTRDRVETIMKARWAIEVYHRELKQTCGIERCQARKGRAQRNHIGLAIKAWLNKQRRRITQAISLYQQDWEVIRKSISKHIKIIMDTPPH